MPSLIDLTGKRFSFLTVLHRHSLRGGKDIIWKCQCDCGNFVLATGPEMKRQHGTKSCGCHRARQTAVRNKHNAIHNMTNTTEFRIWTQMWNRCTNPNHVSYRYYGGRGISVCDKWIDFTMFLADMGARPVNKSLDRYPDTNGNYEPNNCRWATLIQQRHNQRNITTVIWHNRQRPITTLAKSTGIPYPVLKYRISAGWTVEKAIQTPIRKYRA